jgi:hypothetical protein
MDLRRDLPSGGREIGESDRQFDSQEKALNLVLEARSCPWCDRF